MKFSTGINSAFRVSNEFKKTVAFYSLELSREQIAMRFMSLEGSIDFKRLCENRLIISEQGALARCVADFNDANILIGNNSSLTVTDIIEECRSINNLGCVVIDNIQLLQATLSGQNGKPDRKNRVEMVSEILKSLRAAADELNVPIVCLFQLSRENEKQLDKRPILTDFGSSLCDFEQYADVIVGLYRDDYYSSESGNESATPGVVECHVLKNSRGKIGMFELLYNPTDRL